MAEPRSLLLIASGSDRAAKLGEFASDLCVNDQIIGFVQIACQVTPVRRGSNFRPYST